MRIGQKLSIPLIIILIGNIADCVIKQSPLVEYFTYGAVFIVPALLSYFLVKKINFRIISVSLLVISVGAIWLGDGTDLTSIGLLCFALYIGRVKTKHLYFYGLGLSISIMGKFLFEGHGITQLTVYLSGAFFIMVIYEHYIHPKPPRPHVVFCQKLDPVTVQIIQYLADGYIYKEMVTMLELTEPAIRKRITRAREMMQVKSTTELVIRCHKLDYIRYKLDKAPL